MDEVNQIRLENLLKIDQAILDSQSIESIADIALEGLVKLFPNSWVSIASYQKPSDLFQVLAVDTKNKYPEWKPGEIVQVNTHPNLTVLQEGSILEVDDLSKFELGCPPKNVLLEENIQSCLILPLIAEKKLIGVVYVGKRNTDGFDRQEHDMLVGISNQLAVSFHKAQLNDLNNQQRKELSTLLEISTALAGSIVLDEVMQLAIDRATNVLGLDTGALYLLEGSELFLGATTPPLPPDFPHEYRIALLEHHPHIQKSINDGETVYLPDTSTAELTSQERGVMDERSLRSLLFVPLPVGTRIIGVLIMGTMGRTYTFSQNEIDLCRTFSVQMALAVENARLHHRAQQHALELEEMVRNRTAELEALTHAISHDLRAPLRAIKGFGQMLDQDLGEQLTSEGKDLLARMINASTRLEGMM